MIVNIIMVVFVAVALALLPTFFHLAPYLADAVFRARGSEALEFSVRVTRERNIFAYLLLVPAVLIMSRYRLYDPSFMQQFEGAWHLLACLAVLAAYILLRLIIYLILKPRRRFEYFRLAHRAIFTFFILFMLIALPVLGVLTVIDANDLIIRSVLYVLLAVVYLVFLVRKAQILSLSCGGFAVFLYLCALEIIPTAALVVSAAVL
ncbi:MAG: DUF4271 domain-containing protein [Bacteroidales bacterium]|nr:DUF4271 domain-containing protein [Bacteroidales bacterium]